MNLWDDMAYNPVPYAYRILAIIVAIIIIIFLLSGCAQVPLCEKFSLHPAMLANGDPVYVADMENLHKMMKMINGLDQGTCRLE